MRLLIVCLFSAVLFASCSDTIAPEVKYAPLDEVFENLSTIQLGQQVNGKNIGLARKPDGWYLQVFDYTTDNDEPVTTEGLFWSLADSSFHPENLPDMVGIGQQAIEYMQGREELKWQFAVHPYFGYDAWSKDVIEQYGDYDVYSDSLLYGLGRAYSDYTVTLLNTEDTVEFPEAFLLEEGESLNDSQIETYRKYADQSIDCFYQLTKQNADFTTRIGNVSIKHANEHMTAYMDLCIYAKNSHLAKEYLRPEIYDESILTLARNFLNACEPDAILFTAGDNTTYPIWYVQQTEDLRTDVSLINTSLLNIPRYADFLTINIDGTPPVSFSLSSEAYTSTNRDYLLVGGSSGNFSTMTLESLMDFIGDDNNLQGTNGSEVITIPAMPYLLPKPANIPADTSKPFSEGLYFSLHQERYLTRADYLYLGLIQANNWERPIYISTMNQLQNKFGIEAHLFNEGLALHLQPEAGQSYGSKPTNTEALSKNLMEGYDWEWVKALPAKEDLYIENIVQNYRFQFFTLGEACLNEGDTAQAVAAIDRCLEKLPPAQIELKELAYFLSGIYYASGHPDKGGELVTNLVDSFSVSLKASLEGEGEIPVADMEEVQSKMSILNELESVLGQYDTDSDLHTRLQVLNSELWQLWMSRQAPSQGYPPIEF